MKHKTSTIVFDALESRRLQSSIQTVDSRGDVGQHTSLAISPISQRPSVAYYDATNGDLKLATQDVKSRWNVSTIASVGDVGAVNAFKFNKDGEPCVAYNDPTSGALLFARQTHHRWVNQTIDSGGATDVSMVLDSRGRGRVSYSQDDGAAGTSLRFAAFDGKRWNSQSIEEGTADVPVFIESSSLAISSRGFPVIAFAHEIEDSLGVATSTDGQTWTHGAVDHAEGATLGSVPAILVDSKDNIQIAYGGEPDRSGSTFYIFGSVGSDSFSERSIVSNSAFAGFNDSGSTAIAQNPRDGTVRIAYFGGDTSPSLRLAAVSNAATTSAKFSSTTLDSHADAKVGQYPSMAFDRNGTAYIAYYDATAGDVKVFSGKPI